MKQSVFVRPLVGRIMTEGRVLGSLLNVGMDLNQIKLLWSEETETCGQVSDTRVHCAGALWHNDPCKQLLHTFWCDDKFLGNK